MPLEDPWRHSNMFMNLFMILILTLQVLIMATLWVYLAAILPYCEGLLSHKLNDSNGWWETYPGWFLNFETLQKNNKKKKLQWSRNEARFREDEVYESRNSALYRNKLRLFTELVWITRQLFAWRLGFQCWADSTLRFHSWDSTIENILLCFRVDWSPCLIAVALYFRKSAINQIYSDFHFNSIPKQSVPV